MAATQFFFPFDIMVKAGNLAAPGGKLYFYLAGTTTLASIYADSGLSVPLQNPVIADGAGRVPAIYLDDTQSFRLYALDKDDALLLDRDPYIPGSFVVPGAIDAYGFASVKDAAYGAKGDGTTDDTAAFAAIFSASRMVHIPAGTYIVSSLSIPANTTVTTAGHDTIIKRKAGTTDGTRIVNIVGSNVRLGDISVQGLIASEGDEQNHAIFIQANATNGNLQNISVGNVRATGIRGDAVYIGGDATYSVKQVTVGNIYADNCYRNGLSIADNVSGVEIASVYENACGQHTIDFEPNTTGPVRGVWIGHVRGRHIQASGGASSTVEASIESADLDLSNGANSTPNNPVDHKAGSQASGTDNALILKGAILRIGRLKVNGYTGQAALGVSGGLITSKLKVDSAEVTNCCSADTVNNDYFDGGTGLVEYRIGYLKAATTLASHFIIANCNNTQVSKAEIALVTSSQYMRSCTDCRTDELNMTVSGAGNGGSAVVSGTRCFVGGGAQTGDRFFSACTRCVAIGVDATMATSYDASSPTNNKFYASRLGGTDYYLLDLSLAVGWTVNSGLTHNNAIKSSSATGGIGYATGAGGTITQVTSRTTGVTINKVCGQITLVSAAGSASWQTLTVTNSAVAATDIIRLNQVSGTDKYMLHVTHVAAGSFDISFATTGGTTTEQPVLGFAIVKGVTA